MTMKTETVKTDTFSMDYFKIGQGENILVILPGLSVQSVMLFADSVAEEYRVFLDGYTVYVFDRIKELPSAYSIHEMAEDTAAAIRAMDLSRIYLFGASQGGMIAMDIAINHPNLIGKLALCSTSSRMDEAQYAAIEKWIDPAKAGDRKGLYLAFGEAIYPGALFRQSREQLISTAETVTDEDLERFIVLAEGMKGFDMTGDLKKIACPVLVVGSMDDRVLGYAPAVQIAANLHNQQGAVLCMYDGYGHAVYDTAPDMRERLLRFFSQD